MTKKDFADYRAAEQQAKEAEVKYRLKVLFETIFLILWPDRRYVDLTCGLWGDL